MPLAPAPGIATWASNYISSYNTLPTAGNPCSALAFNAKLKFAKQWSDYYGRPVHIGEFGAYTMADPASRARFYSQFRATADSLGLGWAMWDWKAGFRYWDPNTGQPAPGLPAAMFPPPTIKTTGPGKVELNEAIGKTFRIERTLSLTGTVWSAIQTQSLTSTTWNYTDPGAGSNPSAFYRAVWLK